MSIIVFPAIDLKGGQVVRLAEGDMDRATVYGDDPADQARKFAEAGAEWLHVVDLDGAFAGRAVNAEAVEAILKAFPGKVELGGGIRDRAGIDRWLGLGVERVIIGTAALQNPDLVREAAKDLPGRIVVGVDARDGFVATHGWAEVSTVSITDLADRFADAGVASPISPTSRRSPPMPSTASKASSPAARGMTAGSTSPRRSGWRRDEPGARLPNFARPHSVRVERSRDTFRHANLPRLRSGRTE